MDLHLHAQLTAEDYADAQSLHGRKLTYVIYTIMMALLFAVVWVALQFVAPPIAAPAAVAGFIFSLLMSLWTVPRAMTKRTKRIFAQQKSLQVPREIWLNDTELHGKSERGEARIPWDDFYKWKANDKIILIYSSEVLYNMFPRRWFASDADFEALQQLLARVLGPAGKPRKRPPLPPAVLS